MTLKSNLNLSDEHLYSLILKNKDFSDRHYLIKKIGLMLKYVHTNENVAHVVFHFMSKYSHINFDKSNDKATFEASSNICKTICSILNIVSSANNYGSEFSHSTLRLELKDGERLLCSTTYKNNVVDKFNLDQDLKLNPFYLKNNINVFNNIKSLGMSKEVSRSAKSLTLFFGLSNKVMLDDYSFGLVCLYFLRDFFSCHEKEKKEFYEFIENGDSFNFSSMEKFIHDIVKLNLEDNAVDHALKNSVSFFKELDKTCPLEEESLKVTLGNLNFKIETA